MSASDSRCPPETAADLNQASRKDQIMPIKRNAKASHRGAATPTTASLADVLGALEHEPISATRLRDLRSAVQRVAGLLGEDPTSIKLDLAAISSKLAIVNQ